MCFSFLHDESAFEFLKLQVLVAVVCVILIFMGKLSHLSYFHNQELKVPVMLTCKFHV